MSTPSQTYYQNLLTSEYKPTVQWNAWLAAVLAIAEDISACLNSMSPAFDLDYAVGAQLDILGLIVGVRRTLTFQPSRVAGGVTGFAINSGSPGGDYQTGDVVTIAAPMGGTSASFQVSATGVGGTVTGLVLRSPGSSYAVSSNNLCLGGSGTNLQIDISSVGLVYPSPVLDDDIYRLLLVATIANNQWDGTGGGIYALWKRYFANYNGFTIIDNQDMTATLVIPSTLPSILFDMVIGYAANGGSSGAITNSLIIPRPQGVLYNWTTPGNLPAFGFDRNDAFIAGFDTGKFT